MDRHAFYVRSVDRSALVVRPKKPFLDWANQTDPGAPPLTEANLAGFGGVYLVPVVLDEGDDEHMLQSTWEAIFELELSDWTEDRSLWPEGRSLVMFAEWFDVRMQETVVDLCKDPL